MEQDRFRQAERLFHDAMALAPARRQRFIEQAAQGDDTLASHIERMIRYADRASPTGRLLPTLPTPPTLDSPQHQGGRGGGDSAQLVGATIDHYRIIELMGEGGFGAVYRAQQQAPVRRTVALKILKAGGLDSKQVMLRFEAERQALAMMEHPSIARIFDAGQTHPAWGGAWGGRPYFVMELVMGQPITDYCDQRQLDWRARLELFITVCRAVQHAHQKGIIHRDLKPSNILVSEIDGIAIPKVIDFGIAKALDQPMTGGAPVTQARQLLGTPQYMSPEQADGGVGARGVDTRTDVYSLGVILYELLTGSTPLLPETLREVSFSQLQQIIRDQPIERPSTRLKGSVNVESRRMVGTLRGDLDWITLKALEKDRERRYSSASELAEDIRRHLNHEPVLAGPPSAAYRVRKFIRRHRVGTLAAALVALAVVGGAIGTTAGMIRARDAAEQATAVNDFMREVLTSADPDKRGADVRLVDVLGSASDTASQRFAAHPILEAQVRYLLGDVYDRLTLWPQAQREYHRSVVLWREQGMADDPRSLEARLRYVGAAVNAADVRAAEEVLPDLLVAIERVFGPGHLMTLQARRAQVSIDIHRGRTERLETTLLRLRSDAEAAGAGDDFHIQVLHGLLRLCKNEMYTADPERRAVIIAKSVPLAEERVQRSMRFHGRDSAYTFEARLRLAELDRYQGKYEAAAQTCDEILASADRLGPCHYVRLNAMRIKAYALSRLGEEHEPAELLLNQIACMRNAEAGSEMLLLTEISDALPFLDRANRNSEGESLAREFLEILNRMGGGHGHMAYAVELYVARFVSRQNRLDEAQMLFRDLFAREDEVVGRATQTRLHLFYGAHLASLRQFEQAEHHLNRCVALTGDVRKGTRRTHPDDVLVEFIAMYESWGKLEQAAAYRALRHDVLRTTMAAP